MSSSGGTARASSACRSTSGRSIRSAPSRCSASNRNTDSGGPSWRSATAALAARAEVSWNGSGLPSSRSAISSPSSTAARTGSLASVATTSGSRPVISSSVRVNRRTSPPARWAWIRIPSSFHSTAAAWPADLGQRLGDARRAGRQHRPHRPADLQAERAASASLPPASAAAATAPSEPRSIIARRTSATGTEAAPGDRVGHHPFQRALPQLAGQQPEQEPLLGPGGPAEQLTDQRLARRRRPLPGHRPDRGERRVHLGQGQRGRSRGREPAPQRRPADPDLPLRQLPDRYATAIGTSSGPASRSAAASMSIFASRALVAPTACDTSAISARSTRPFSAVPLRDAHGSAVLGPPPPEAAQGGRRVLPGAQSQYPTGTGRRTCR